MKNGPKNPEYAFFLRRYTNDQQVREKCPTSLVIKEVPKQQATPHAC